MLRLLKLLAACGLPVILAIPAGILLAACQAGDALGRARRRRREKLSVRREIRDFNRELDREMQEWR